MIIPPQSKRREDLQIILKTYPKSATNHDRATLVTTQPIKIVILIDTYNSIKYDQICH